MKVQEISETQKTKKLTGKVALVTGGSHGIGAGIATKLASEGAKVVITYAKNKNAADEVVESITNSGGQALAFQADVASGKQTQNLIDKLKHTVDKIDILINNAGVWAGGKIDSTDLEQYDYIFDTNVKGTIASTMAALKLIPDGGRIINLSSVAAEATLPGFSIYSASKSAINTLTRIWAQELGKRQITVNAVAPGPVVTDMLHEAMSSADVLESSVARTALGRLGTPDDIANVVAFLASTDGGWITGQAIRADGGINH